MSGILASSVRNAIKETHGQQSSKCRTQAMVLCMSSPVLAPPEVLDNDSEYAN